MGLPFLTNFCIIVIKRILHILLAGLLFTLPSFGGELKVFTPEQFGARADGRTDNKAAFLALSKAVNSNGGGRVVFPFLPWLLLGLCHIRWPRARASTQSWVGMLVLVLSFAVLAGILAEW